MIVRSYHASVADDQHIHRAVETATWYSIHADIVFHTPQFLDFQTEMIDEVLSTIVGNLDENDLFFEDATEMFESCVKQANQALTDFAHRMNSVPSFDIRGCLMMSRHSTFVSAVIGNASLLLARRGHVGYTMHNDADISQRITLFSDLIEGELQEHDQLYFAGTQLEALLDREELAALAQKCQSYSPEQSLSLWFDALSARIDSAEVGMLAVYGVWWVVVSKDRGARVGRAAAGAMSSALGQIGGKVSSVFSSTAGRIREKLHHKQFAILLTIAAIFLLFTLWSIVHSRLKNTATQHINSDGTVTAALSIDDIKKEIAAFQKLDPTSEEKSTKYNAIIKELQRIQNEGKRASDVQQLKKIIDTEYYQGFNIITFDSLQDQLIYSFSSLELSALARPLALFFHKGIHVAGSRWALLAGISNDIRWTAVRGSSDADVTTCSLDLAKSGLFCATSKNTLVHISKVGSEPIGGENVIFPWSVIGIATFGSANMYLLTADPLYTKDKTFIVRYTNVLGSQNNYGASTLLPLVDAAGTEAYAQGLSSFAIDGSFLAWSNAEKTLVQMYRNPQDKALTSREVPLKGGVSLGQWFSTNVKVMTTPGTRYVYLYDRTYHTLSVYISTPAKNSDAFSANYWLDYVMRADFSKMGTMPLDVVVDESDGKQTAYVLMDVGVAKVPMSDLLDSLKKTRATQSQ